MGNSTASYPLPMHVARTREPHRMLHDKPNIHLHDNNE